MKNNQHYFKISQANPEPQLDLNYFLINKEPQIKEYIKNVKNIKEILITIKKLKENKEKKVIVQKYYKELFNNFNNFSNCSELGCFVSACDTTRDLVRKDFKSFKKITDFFITKRIINDRAPENWIQAIIDNNASRKKGKLGENKLIKILIQFDYKLVKTWDEFDDNKRCVANFSKGIFSFENVEKRLKIGIKTKNQAKMLDLLIKSNNRIFILEAKHLNTEGGEQNKQIDELIKILELEEKKRNIFYVSFLDGTYSNKLIVDDILKRSKKLARQRNEIESCLNKKNSKNYWLNTAGFVELFKK